MIQLNSFYLKKRGTHQILSCVDEKTKIFKQDIVENKNLCFEGLSIDKYRRVVIHGETEIELTYTEFEILLLLAQNAGIVFSIVHIPQELRIRSGGTERHSASN